MSAELCPHRNEGRRTNYRDLLMVKGLYNPRQELPLVPFSDGVGRYGTGRRGDPI